MVIIRLMNKIIIQSFYGGKGSTIVTQMVSAVSGTKNHDITYQKTGK